MMGGMEALCRLETSVKLIGFCVTQWRGGWRRMLFWPIFSPLWGLPEMSLFFHHGLFFALYLIWYSIRNNLKKLNLEEHSNMFNKIFKKKCLFTFLPITHSCFDSNYEAKWNIWLASLSTRPALSSRAKSTRVDLWGSKDLYSITSFQKVRLSSLWQFTSYTYIRIVYTVYTLAWSFKHAGTSVCYCTLCGLVSFCRLNFP